MTRLPLAGSVLATLLGAWIVLHTGGCGNMTEPGPPDVTTYPQLKPDATASTNLAAVVELERAAGRQGRLVAVSGRVNRQGQLVEGGPWYYTFREPNDVPGAVYQWRVDAQGVVTQDHFGMCGLAFSEDLSGGVGIDSDHIIEPALSQGGQDFLARYPAGDTFALVYGDGQARVYFSTPDCYRPSIGLSRRTGAVTDTSSLICVGLMTRPCGGPGAF